MIRPTVDSLRGIIQVAANSLKVPDGVDPVLLLGTIAEIESGFGQYALPKYEKLYDFGEKYSDHAKWLKWGAWAACSYSSFQIMYPTACEFGFDSAPWNRNPMDLWDDEIAVLFVVDLLNTRILGRGARNLFQIADAYNSGSFQDDVYPMEYINKFKVIYSQIGNLRNLKTGGVNV